MPKRTFQLTAHLTVRTLWIWEVVDQVKCLHPRLHTIQLRSLPQRLIRTHGMMVGIYF
jgi:hypothetical protein